MKKVTLVSSVVGLFFLSYFFAFPKEFVLRSDDFGYFDAISKTIISGHLSSSDWLAPSNFGFTALSSLIYLATHHFYLATFGLVLFSFVLAAWLFFLIARHFRMNTETSLMLMVFVFSTPIIFHKALDFTGFVTYLAVFLGAILAHLKNRNWIFYGLVLFSLTIRQSSVALLAFMLPALFQAVQLKKWRLFLKTALPAVLTLAIFFILDRSVPKGFASQTQVNLRGIIEGMNFRNICLMISQILLYGLPVMALMQFLTGTSSRAVLKENYRINFPVAALIAVLTSVSCGFQFRELVFGTEVPFLFDVLERLLPLTFISLFMVDFKSIRLNSFLCGGIAYSCLLVLRGELGDYYLIDLFFYLTFSVLSSKTITGVPSAFIPSALAGWVLLMGYGCNHLIQDKTARFQMLESAYRSGKLSFDLASDSPWGLMGWKLFPYFVQYGNETERKTGCLICMMKYVHQGTSGFLYAPGDGAPPNQISDGAEIVAQRKLNSVFFPQYLTLYKTEKNASSRSIFYRESAVIPLDRTRYSERCAPMTNREWNRFLESKGLSCE